MEKVQVIIEQGKDGKFSAHTTSFQSFGLLGYGDSVAETIADFLSAYEEVKEIKGASVPKLNFDFQYSKVEAPLHRFAHEVEPLRRAYA